MKILTQKTVEVLGYSNFIKIGLVIGITLFVLSIFATMASASGDPAKVGGYLICFFGSSIITLSLLICGYTPKEEYTEYKVIFTEEINWNEFSKDYEIISQEGELVIIKDKENRPIQK